MFTGDGRRVDDIAVQELNLIAKTLGALGDWAGLVGLFAADSRPGGAALPALDRQRCARSVELYYAVAVELVIRRAILPCRTKVFFSLIFFIFV